MKTSEKRHVSDTFCITCFAANLCALVIYPCLLVVQGFWSKPVSEPPSACFSNNERFRGCLLALFSEQPLRSLIPTIAFFGTFSKHDRSCRLSQLRGSLLGEPNPKSLYAQSKKTFGVLKYLRVGGHRRRVTRTCLRHLCTHPNEER